MTAPDYHGTQSQRLVLYITVLPDSTAAVSKYRSVGAMGHEDPISKTSYCNMHMPQAGCRHGVFTWVFTQSQKRRGLLPAFLTLPPPSRVPFGLPPRWSQTRDSDSLLWDGSQSMDRAMPMGVWWQCHPRAGLGQWFSVTLCVCHA